MARKLIPIGALLVAFFVGTLTGGLLKRRANATPAPSPTNQTLVPQGNGFAETATALRPAGSAPSGRLVCYEYPEGTAPSRVVYEGPAERAAYRSSAYESAPRRYHRHRTWKRHALIIGGSAGAGTAIGALAGGKKGAAIGAVSGGAAGLAYDLITKNKK